MPTKLLGIALAFHKAASEKRALDHQRHVTREIRVATVS